LLLASCEGFLISVDDWLSRRKIHRFTEVDHK
jgi:hypothetical protein